MRMYLYFRLKKKPTYSSLFRGIFYNLVGDIFYEQTKKMNDEENFYFNYCIISNCIRD